MSKFNLDENVEFRAWAKIPRDKGGAITITEKIDGTNGCIVVNEGQIIGVQSRKRIITPCDDNFGFASWVRSNAHELCKLGNGYHYGEWAGPGIQKNPHNLDGKKFFLFNSFRWNELNTNRPACCDVVPVLFEGVAEKDTIQVCMKKINDEAGDLETPEGVIVYSHDTRTYTKHTFRNSKGKWAQSD